MFRIPHPRKLNALVVDYTNVLTFALHQTSLHSRCVSMFVLEDALESRLRIEPIFLWRFNIDEIKHISLVLRVIGLQYTILFVVGP